MRPGVSLLKNWIGLANRDRSHRRLFPRNVVLAALVSGGTSDMTTDPFYKAHWRNIEPGRMFAYRKGFGWDAATERLYRPLDISEGQTIADFGCGPGKVAVELARRVGPKGRVHAIDINAEFLEVTLENAADAQVSERVTAHQSDGAALPLPDASLDRITARNTIMYVDDPVTTLREFHRALRPGGLAHAIEGDWYMMVAEPVEHDRWREFVKAASHACRNADMGRKLFGALAQAEFQDIEISLTANPDTNGRLIGMIRNMAKYALESGAIDARRVESILQEIAQAQADGTYLVASPLFIATGRK